MGVEDLDGALEPGEVEATLGRFHEGPGELGDADVRDAHGLHGSGVFFPERFRHVLGVVVDTEERHLELR